MPRVKLVIGDELGAIPPEVEGWLASFKEKAEHYAQDRQWARLLTQIGMMGPELGELGGEIETWDEPCFTYVVQCSRDYARAIAARIPPEAFKGLVGAAAREVALLRKSKEGKVFSYLSYAEQILAWLRRHL